MNLANEDPSRGLRIRALRETYKPAKARGNRKRFTQADLARAIGVDSGTVSRWELGRKITPKNVEKLAAFFSVDFAFIADGPEGDVATYPAFNEYRAWLEDHPEEMEALPEGGLETIRTLTLKVPADYEPGIQNYMVLHSFFTGLKRKKRSQG